MSGGLLCRVGWHSWTGWVPGKFFIDTSYGLETPKRNYVSRCRRCNKPRRMSLIHIRGEQ